ncbi:hypothetical protein D3C71_1738420 [compost metagenome]
MLKGNPESGASNALKATSDRLAWRSIACASGANCVSSRLSSRDAPRSAPANSVPMASNGTLSTLVRMLFNCCCN